MTARSADAAVTPESERPQKPRTPQVAGAAEDTSAEETASRDANVRDRVILPLNRRDLPGPILKFDLGSLFLHLLLFDTVIVPSLALLDFAELGKVLGAGRTAALLSSGCVRIRAAADSLGSVDLRDHRYIKLMHVRANDPEAGFASYLNSFEKAGLSSTDCKILEDAVRACWIAPVTTDSWGADAIADTVRDATANPAIFLKAVERELRSIGRIIRLSPGQMRVEEVTGSPGEMRLRYRIEGVNAQLAAKIARSACRAIAHLNGQFHQMKRDQAVTSISDNSADLMETKLDLVWRALKPMEPMEQFHRISNIANLPSFDEELTRGTIDIERFLEVRQSVECREFRMFLTYASSFNEVELSERIESLRSRMGNFLQSSNVAKSVRVLFTTAIGAVAEALTGASTAGLIAGATASGADTFILERLFPKSGVVAFLGKQYPSIFKA